MNGEYTFFGPTKLGASYIRVDPELQGYDDLDVYDGRLDWTPDLDNPTFTPYAYPMKAKKTCPSCQRTLNRDKFGQNLSAPDRHAWYCRECANEKQREWKAANAPKITKWRKAYVKRMRARNGGEV